jgi:hypothetical protein
MRQRVIEKENKKEQSERGREGEDKDMKSENER